jgi:hypothetical protein
MIRTFALPCLTIGSILGSGVSVQALQFVDDPVIPQGTVLLEVRPSSQFLGDFYRGSSGERFPMGSPFFVSDLGGAQVPHLLPTEDRFRALASDPGAPALRIGSTTGVMKADEQVVPFQFSYGLRDRITVGLTVPLIRKRVDAHFQVDPSGANVGRNPGAADPAAVSAFFQESTTALNEVRGDVDSICGEAGESHPDCMDGLALINDLEGFLDELDAAYQAELLFPLSGSTLGSLVQTRWTGYRNQLADYGSEAPELVPLASEPLNGQDFRATLLEEAWPAGGFPVENEPSFLGLGDIELHVAVPLLDLEFGQDAGRSIRLRTAGVGTLRLGSGEADSLRTTAPTEAPRGISGVDLRLVTDVLLSDRLALLSVTELSWHGSSEFVLLAPDPERPFSPGHTRSSVSWEPGNQVRLSLTPRIRLGQALSLGGGWHYMRRDPDRVVSAADGTPLVTGPLGSSGHLHRIALEMRYSVMTGQASEGLRFPVEVLLRASRSVAGSNMPATRRIEGGMRVLTRR